MKREKSVFPGPMFNLLILFTFGLFLILIKNFKQDDNPKTPLNKTFDKNPAIKKKVKTEIEPKPIKKFEDLNPRQEIVMNELVKVGEITPKELKKLIPDVSTRTIRRDMDSLAEKGLVEQKGSTKSTYYQYKA